LKIKIGLVGVGRFGENHCKILNALNGVDFQGIYDISPARNHGISEKYKLRAFANLDKLLDKVQALVVAVPTKHHFETASQALNNGTHVFLEKPMTATLREAKALVRLSEKRNLILQVGHIERFNPAFCAFEAQHPNPVLINCQRLSPFEARCTDVSVILDLMIHDLDIVLNIVKSEVVQTEASGYSECNNEIDFARSEIRFANGTVAIFTASRIANNKFRKMHCLQKDRWYAIDYLQKTLKTMSLQKHGLSLSQFMTKDNKDNFSFEHNKNFEMNDIPVVPFNSLEKELTSFVQAIISEEKPIVNAHDGLQVLKVVDEIEKQVHESQRKIFV